MGFYQEQQSETRAAPAVDAAGGPGKTTGGHEVGLRLGDAEGFRLTLAAPAGQTLTAAGSLRCYLYSAGLQLWMRNEDLDVEVTRTGERAQAWPDFPVAVGNADAVLYACDGVVLAGTATDASEQDKPVVRLESQGVLR